MRLMLHAFCCRSLGVHLSFVRSSTMDAWQPQQLKLMEVGGNTKCKNFFIEYVSPAYQQTVRRGLKKERFFLPLRIDSMPFVAPSLLLVIEAVDPPHALSKRGRFSPLNEPARLPMQPFISILICCFVCFIFRVCGTCPLRSDTPQRRPLITDLCYAMKQIPLSPPLPH